MEKKEFKVQIPEGYVIDEENSTFDKVVFKPNPEKLDYRTVFKALYCDEDFNVKTEQDGICLHLGLKAINGFERDSAKRLDKVLSYFQLLNIARYFNGGWKPDWRSNEDKYHIAAQKNKFMETPPGFMVMAERFIDYGAIYFKNKEDAQAVIDNPNFRQILKDYFA